MTEKKEDVPKDSPFLEVELIAEHTHKDKLCHAGDKITIHKRQLSKLREWGKVK